MVLCLKHKNRKKVQNYTTPIPKKLSKITDKLAKFKISIKRLIQTPDHKSNKATIVMTTHKTTELKIQNCLKENLLN